MDSHCQMSDPAQHRATDGRPTGDVDDRHGLGMALWLTAFLTVVAALLVRAIQPALPGVWVGVGHVITALKLAGALSSQLCAVASAALIVAMVVVVARGSLPSGLRAFSVGVAMMVVLSLLISTGMLATVIRWLMGRRLTVRLPVESALVLAGAVGVFVMAAAHLRSRLHALRGPSLVVGAVGTSSLVRVVAVGCAYIAQRSGSATVHAVSRSLATLGFVLELVAVTVALVWMASAWPQRPAGRARKSGLALLAVVLVVAALTSYLTLAGRDPEARGIAVLFARAAERLTSHPLPYLPGLVIAFVEAVSWLLVLSTLLLVVRGRLLAAAVALALLARGGLESPLAAAALALAACALIVAEPSYPPDEALASPKMAD